MNVKLMKAEESDLEEIRQMQVTAFSELLEKYQDYGTSPASESLDRIREKYVQPGSFYYFITDRQTRVGVIRIVDRKDGSRKRISPLWIMPEYRNRGYAQSAIIEAERIHGPDNWCLDTILQEKGNLHLYEKMGYHQTGRTEKINQRMDIVYFEKNCMERKKTSCMTFS